MSVVDRNNFSVRLVLYDPNYPFMLFTVLHMSMFLEIRFLSFVKGHLLTLQSGRGQLRQDTVALLLGSMSDRVLYLCDL